MKTPVSKPDGEMRPRLESWDTTPAQTEARRRLRRRSVVVIAGLLEFLGQ
jgi:hypothetical protein